MKTRTLYQDRVVWENNTTCERRFPIVVHAEPLPWEQAVNATELGARVVKVWYGDVVTGYLNPDDYDAHDVLLGNNFTFWLVVS